MSRSSKPSLFDRKLEALRKQSRLIEQDVRALEKSMRKIEEGGTLPPLQSSTSAVPDPHRVEAASSASIESSRAAADELAREVQAESDEEPGPVAESARNRPLQPTPHFKRYLATGSFGGGRPLAEERRVMRNRALVMIVVVVFLALLLYQVIQRAVL